MRLGFLAEPEPVADLRHGCPFCNRNKYCHNHLDDYAVGKGWRQTAQGMPALSERYPATFIYWTDDGGTILSLGDQQLNLRGAASAAIELARVVERVRARQLERAEKEANAALRERWLPPD